MRSRGISAALAIAAVLLTLPGAASARITYAKGGWIYAAGDNGERPKRLARGGAPYLSPDGKRVLFFRKGGKAYAMKTSGRAVIRLGLAARQDPLKVLSWAPDGSAIATLSEHDAPLYVPLDGGKVKLLAASGSTGISFSPDGRQIVFDQDSATPRTTDLVITAVGGGVIRRVSGPYASVLWIPGGIVTNYINDPFSGLALVSPDGATVTPLAGTTRPNSLILFDLLSSNGDLLIAKVLGAGEGPIVTIKVSTQQVVSVRRIRGGLFGSLDMSANRQYTVSNGRLRVTDLRTGRTRTLVRSGVTSVSAGLND